ncbi:MAG: ECF transporter S component [Candidatus Altiarchaeota archaeon]|nr:ECF transporter S component [Candidatus Altiarchaeota archaeon]
MKGFNPGILSGSILAIAGLRLMMAPYPNIEPIMFFVLTTALVFGPLAGFLLGLGTMIVSDFYIGLLGPWTLYTSFTYGMVGLAAGFIGLKKKEWNRTGLTLLAFALTVFYDMVTATFWALQTLQPLTIVYALQIPFTLLHLSNCVFVCIFAPYMMKAFETVKDFSITGCFKRFWSYV